MNTSPELVERLLATLGHSLWQGAALAVLLYMTLRLLPGRYANARYLLALAALALLAAAPPATWAFLSRPEAVEAVQTLTAAPGTGSFQAYVVHENAPDALVPMRPPQAFPWQTALAVAWLGGVALGLGRLLGAVGGARRLRRGGFAPGAELLDRATALAARLRVSRPVQVLLHGELGSPAVCGWWRPVILVPASLVTGLPPAHLEAVLAHELAHIRRHDYLVNLAQLTLEALLYFNPFVWWISRQVRLEREAACDALAVSILENGAPTDYVRVLAGIAEKALPVPVALPAMSGPRGERGHLLERARRLLRPGERPRLRLSWPAALGFLLASFGVLALLRVTAEAAVDLLTTQEERVEKTAEIQKQFPVREVEVAEFKEDYANQNPDKKIEVRGRFISGDGVPLPEKFKVDEYWDIRVGNSSSGGSMAATIPSTGEVKHKGQPGTWNARFFIEGYAPTFVNLGTLKEDLKGLEFPLVRGFSARIRVLDDRDQPIPGAKVKTGYDLNMGPSPTEREADAEGLVALEHVAAEPMKFAANFPGFQETEWKNVRLKPGQTLDLKLERAAPTTGRVLDAETGQPLAGVELRVGYTLQNGNSSVSHGGNRGPLLATTGADGAFTMTSLRPDTRYFVHVIAKGYLWELLGEVRDAQALPEVRLKRAPVLTCRVKGLSPKQLYGKDRVRLNYRLKFMYGKSGHESDFAEYEVPLKEGEAVFTFPLLAEMDAILDIGNVYRTFSWAELEKLRGPLVIDFSTPEAPKPAEAVGPPQAVEIVLKTPEGLPKASGRMVVKFVKGGLSPANQTRNSASQVVTVANGVARFQVPGPNDIYFGPEGLLGYWFPEPFSGEDIPLKTDGQPVRLVVECQPAGAIYGKITGVDGKPAQGAMFGIFTDPKHRVLQGRSPRLNMKDSSNPNDDSGRYHAGPLPLGGKFTFYASRGTTYIFTPALTLDEKTPFQEANLRFPVGETVSGTVTDEAGNPLKGVELSMRIRVHELNMGTAGATTDAQGRFSVSGLNPEVPGQYEFEVEAPANYVRAFVPIRFGEPNNIRLKKGLILRGIVRDHGTGKPVPEAELYVARPKYDLEDRLNFIDAPKLSDSQGRFEFSNLPPGPWRLETRSGQETYVDIDKAPVYQAGQAEEIIFEIIPRK